MARYLILIFWGIVFIVVSVLLVRSMKPEAEPAQVIQAEHQRVIEPDLVEPQVVKVTYGDGLYHNPNCTWVGSDSRQMSLSRAIELGFKPCPFCIEEQDKPYKD